MPRSVTALAARLDFTHVTSFPSLAIIEEHPVVHAVFRLVCILQNFRKELAQEVVVGRLLEPELAHVVEVDRVLVRERLAELLDRRALLPAAGQRDPVGRRRTSPRSSRTSACSWPP